MGPCIGKLIRQLILKYFKCHCLPFSPSLICKKKARSLPIERRPIIPLVPQLSLESNIYLWLFCAEETENRRDVNDDADAHSIHRQRRAVQNTHLQVGHHYYSLPVPKARFEPLIFSLFDDCSTTVLPPLARRGQCYKTFYGRKLQVLL